MVVTAPNDNGYKLVQNTIREKISRGEWRPGFKIPSERDLGKEFSLHRLTVSKSLVNLATEGLLVRRRGQGTFVSDQTIQSKTQRKFIKFIPSVSSKEGITVRHGVLEGIHRVLAKAGYHVGVDFYHNVTEEIELLRQDKDPYHAGFAIWYVPDEQIRRELERLKNEGYPFVLVDAYPDNLETDYVVTDNIEGSQSVVRYLTQAGHKSITYISRKTDRTSLEDRLTGFVRGMITCRQPITEKSTILLNGNNENALEEVAAVLDFLLSGPAKPTAIFFSHDDLALRAIDILRAKNIRVPEDISIVGYDNIDASAYGPVPLTTVAQDFFEIGTIAGQILLERFENKSGSRPIQLSVKPKIIERKSVKEIP
jgi:GntR family transcriptional regulator, arabinose operon transcriptional repressor